MPERPTIALKSRSHNKRKKPFAKEMMMIMNMKMIINLES